MSILEWIFGRVEEPVKQTVETPIPPEVEEFLRIKYKLVPTYEKVKIKARDMEIILLNGEKRTFQVRGRAYSGSQSVSLMSGEDAYEIKCYYPTYYKSFCNHKLHIGYYGNDPFSVRYRNSFVTCGTQVVNEDPPIKELSLDSEFVYNDKDGQQHSLNPYQIKELIPGPVYETDEEKEFTYNRLEKISIECKTGDVSVGG